MNTSFDFSDLITPQQLADIRNVTRKTVYNWLKAGTAPPHTTICERVYFFRSQALDGGE